MIGQITAKQQWEYRTLRGQLNDRDLNLAGQSGWELVSAYTSGTGIGIQTRYIFKRPLSWNSP